MYEIICQQQSEKDKVCAKKKYIRLEDGLGRMGEVRRVSTGNAPPQGGLLELPSQEWNTTPSEHFKYPDGERLIPIQYNQQQVTLESLRLPPNDEGSEKVTAKPEANQCNDDETVRQLQILPLSDTQNPFEAIPLAEDLANDIDNIFKV